MVDISQVLRGIKHTIIAELDSEVASSKCGTMIHHHTAIAFPIPLFLSLPPSSSLACRPPLPRRFLVFGYDVLSSLSCPWFPRPDFPLFVLSSPLDRG